MAIRWPPMIAGLVIAFWLLAFVTKLEFLGSICYAVGDASILGKTYCLKPGVYWGAWFVAAILILVGISTGSGSQDPAQSTTAREPPLVSEEARQASARWERLGKSAYYALYVLMALAVVAFAYYNNGKKAVDRTSSSEPRERAEPGSTAPSANSKEWKATLPDRAARDSSPQEPPPGDISGENETSPNATDAKPTPLQSKPSEDRGPILKVGATPSFDCARAKFADEIAICASDDLARLERAMVRAYSEENARRSDGIAKGVNLKTAMRSYLMERRQCRSDAPCIKDVLSREIVWLQRTPLTTQVETKD